MCEDNFFNFTISLKSLCITSVASNLKLLENDEFLLRLPNDLKTKIITCATRSFNGLHTTQSFNALLNKSIWELNLFSSIITDEVLNEICTKSYNLKELRMKNASYAFTKEGILSTIPKLKHLERFEINNCIMIDDKFIEKLSMECKKLNVLSISNCNITDKSFDAINRFNLNKLNLSKTKITDKFLLNLGNSNLSKYIEDLNISNCNITNKGISFLKWDKLKYVGFNGCTVDDLSFIGLQGTTAKYVEWTIDF